MGPHTETLGLVAPGDWVDFFRYVGEAYAGVIVPEHDDRDLKSHVIPKVMKAPKDFDVNFVRPGVDDYTPPAVADWLDSENVLPAAGQAYFLRSNTGPRQIFGGVLSRPYIFAGQNGGMFAMTSLEGSSAYGKSPLAEKWLTFKTVDHVFAVQEGLLRVKARTEGGSGEWTEVREGQTLVIPAGQGFLLEFGSRFVRAILSTNGKGIEELIKLAGNDCSSVVLPDEITPSDPAKLQKAVEEVGATLDQL